MALPRRNALLRIWAMPLVRAVCPSTPNSMLGCSGTQERSKTKPGAQPRMRAVRYGETEPSPHIERQSCDARSIHSQASPALRSPAFSVPLRFPFEFHHHVNKSENGAIHFTSFLNIWKRRMKPPRRRERRGTQRIEMFGATDFQIRALRRAGIILSNRFRQRWYCELRRLNMDLQSVSLRRSHCDVANARDRHVPKDLAQICCIKQ